jgi:NDP-sugar pyrophosphorylase family protein
MLPAAILAGGLATRLRPLTELIPKALIEINGEPFLAHQMKLLERSGIREVVLCVGYLGEQVREFAGDGSRFGLHIEYSFDGPKLLGTAGALRQALPYLGPAFFVLYGDSYLTCDYLAVERHFFESKKLGLMTVFENAGRGDTSNVEFSGGQILDYNKVNLTPRMRHIDYGLGVFAARAFQELDRGKPHDLATLYRDLLLRGELAAYEADEMFHEIGSVAGIEELGEFLRK